jgi:hypothetical protein
MPSLNLPVALPMQSRRAELSRVDVETRTLEVIWTTGASVDRIRWEGWDTAIPYVEELLVTDRSVNLERMNAGAPVLDSHSTWSTRSQVAVVERAWIDTGKGYAAIRFPKAGLDEAADRLFGLASDKIVRNISVGYSIDQVRVVRPEKRDEKERRIVERWTPHEISFVTVPADPGAQVRSQDVRQFPVAFEILGGAVAAAARMRMRARHLSA